VIAVPTTVITILRGQTTNAGGDIVDLPTPWKTGIRASLIERSQQVIGPTESDDRIVRRYKLRVANGTGLKKDDRIRTADGRVFIIDNVYQQANPFWSPDQAADLSLTS
jgi:hypothetical protein